MSYKLALAAGIALVVCLILGPLLIPRLHKWKFGQNIRSDGPRHHLSKAGTPTVGGVIIMLGVLVAVMVCAYPLSITAVICLVSFILFGALGFVDDFIKIKQKRNLGLSVTQKFVGQFAIIGIVLVMAALAGRGTVMEIPIIQATYDLGWFYYPFVAVLLVGMINAVNLTDGLDGLASGSVALSSLAFMFIAVVNWNNSILAYGDGAFGVVVFACALIGACIGFLRFNIYPAKVFMGDCGSLALGGALAAMALTTRTEMLFLIIGAVYLVEALSVMLQVLSFKTRGKRIFRMSPLHHHFELGGWSEQKVVRSFWFWSFVAAAAGVWFYVA